ncbi:hypothetical protein LINPERPRIM_LOCUS39096 [Linum perenne]
MSLSSDFGHVQAHILSVSTVHRTGVNRRGYFPCYDSPQMHQITPAHKIVQCHFWNQIVTCFMMHTTCLLYCLRARRSSFLHPLCDLAWAESISYSRLLSMVVLPLFILYI